jgi:hypothetical protein
MQGVLSEAAGTVNPKSRYRGKFAARSMNVDSELRGGYAVAAFVAASTV